MSLHFVRRGEGPPLVMIHGLFGSLENLGGLSRILAESFTIYALDLPAHGRSPHLEDLRLASIIDTLLAWADSQSLDQFYVLGHSLGGKVAMELALTHPERVSKLIVMDISPVEYEPLHNPVFAGLLAVDLNSLASRADADRVMQAYVPESAVRSFLLKNLVKESGSFSWRMDLHNIHKHYPLLIGENAPDKVFPREALFIKGGLSDYIQERHRDAILSRFPNAKLKVVADVAHWLHAEKPDTIARLANNFLTKGSAA